MGIEQLTMVNGFFFYPLLAMNSALFRLVKMNSVIIKGTAFTLCKSRFGQYRYC